MAALLYQGTALSDKAQSDAYGIDPYLPSDTLVKSVQLAQVLQRPLLVKGEPGCGKSRLAEAIAAELHGPDFRLHYFEWNVKSSSKALDGLYVIDHLQRLRDANLADAKDIDLRIRLQKDEHGHYTHGKYLTLGQLGLAFQATHSGLPAPPVVLIDEIDKADIDFPNDLLLEIDRMEFAIPEARDTDGQPVAIRANRQLRPLFIITSNDEKPLPPAFLRRCIFHYIDFSEVKLEDIVASKFPQLASQPDTVRKAVETFKALRQRISAGSPGTKNISTSELLDWVKLIVHFQATGQDIAWEEGALPPYHQALLKDLESIQLFMKTH